MTGSHEEISSTQINKVRPTRVDVIIVSYNALRVLPQCLDSIRDASNDNIMLDVTVVDNMSNDGIIEYLSENYPEVKVLSSGYNAGFSVANNIALRKASSDFVLILNPDTVLRPNVLEHLIGEAERDSRIGMMGCRLEQADGTFDHAAKRNFPSPRDALKYFLRKRNASSTYLAPQVDENGLGEVDAVNGAFMLVRREAIDEVGLFDERYWMYGEDLDWCRRFKKSGWKVVYDGRVTVVHLKSAISGKLRNLKLNWHFHKSMAMFYREYDSSRHWVLNMMVYGGIFARAILLSVKYLFNKLFTPRRALTSLTSQTASTSNRQVEHL